MSYKVIRPKTHEEWLEQRFYGIGSSEAGTIMGVNKFDTPYKLWRRKTGIDGPIPGNEAMELGHHMEDAVATMFAQHAGVEIQESSKGDWIAVDTRHSHRRVSPDRIFFYPGEAHTRKNQHILECKTTSVAVDPDDIPAYWYCQLQYQMGVMGVQSGALGWITSSPRLHFDWVKIEFNEPFFKALVEAIDNFWNVNVQQGIAPEDQNSDDTLLRCPRTEEGEVLEADEQLIDDYNGLKQVTASIKALEETKAVLEDNLKRAMGTAESLVTPGGTVLAQWKNTKESQRFNPKAFQAADPEGYAKYIETIPGGRRFTVK